MERNAQCHGMCSSNSFERDQSVWLKSGNSLFDDSRLMISIKVQIKSNGLMIQNWFTTFGATNLIVRQDRGFCFFLKVARPFKLGNCLTQYSKLIRNQLSYSVFSQYCFKNRNVKGSTLSWSAILYTLVLNSIYVECLSVGPMDLIRLLCSN